MNGLKKLVWLGASCLLIYLGSGMMASGGESLVVGSNRATMTSSQNGDLRNYTLTSTAELRGDATNHRAEFSDAPDHARLRTGNVMFDGLYALAVHEAVLNSVARIKDPAYDHDQPIAVNVYQTGELWPYVWTRDVSYSVYLALAQFDPQRAVNSLLFKTSMVKPSVIGGYRHQIMQDTGSGGSYPDSSDRVVWALGAVETLKFLAEAERERFLKQIYPILHDTIEQDRRLVFDPTDGLYRGEQSFLDWREQTYPGWTKDNVLAIAMSKALSVNVADYFLLKKASAYAGRMGLKADEIRYTEWAAELKESINRHFFDPDAGLYSTYLLSDGVNEIRVQRYDLLGESLAILCGVADPAQVEAILKSYPVGSHGPPVVWPQEPTVPIYHNQAIWPFVTAFWIKAARQADEPAAVNAGIRSLEQLAALNLSNMENYDFVSGKAEVKGRRLNGPVVNSRRQLWSVAGYLSMVQDIVFGLETSWDGIRFHPFITAKLRNETFADTDQIELHNFVYQGTTNDVRVHLPPKSAAGEGVCVVSRIELNGRKVGDSFVTRTELHSSNQWDIYLTPPQSSWPAESLREVDMNNEHSLFGPVQPVWDESQNGGINVQDGKLVLHYLPGGATNVVFNIYRDGRLCAASVRKTSWTDADSADYKQRVHYYAVSAVDTVSGNVSHLTPPRCHLEKDQERVIRAANMKNHGGRLVATDHFADWGKPEDTLLAGPFKVERGGYYAIRVRFSNGAGPVSTGITCAVKQLEVCRAGDGKVLVSGHVVMPQSGDWNRWDLSSPIIADLASGERYVIRLREDEVSRNMSYLENNEHYTAWPGGGEAGYNYVNVRALQLINLGDVDPSMTGNASQNLDSMQEP